MNVSCIIPRNIIPRAVTLLCQSYVHWSPPEEKDCDSWIAQQSKQLSAQDSAYYKLRLEHAETKTHDEIHEEYCNLLAGDEIECFNYFLMLGVRTEYYYCYSGSQTIPPCYGNVNENSRAGTNHWRVLKDPIRIHPRQLQELKRLLAMRIAPVVDPVNRCVPDTASFVAPDGTVEANQPLPYFHTAYFFCECKD
jgi:hypothetical protein